MTLRAEQSEIDLRPDECAAAANVPVVSRTDAAASADGSTVLLDLAVQGDESRYAVPLDAVLPLTEALTNAAAIARRAQTGEPEALNVHNVNWWTVRTVPGSPTIVVSFRTASGAEFGFQMHRDAADQMRETLAVAFGYGPAVPSGLRH